MPLAYEMSKLCPAAPLSPALQISSVPFAADATPVHSNAMKAAAIRAPIVPLFTSQPPFPLERTACLRGPRSRGALECRSVAGRQPVAYLFVIVTTFTPGPGDHRNVFALSDVGVPGYGLSTEAS